MLFSKFIIENDNLILSKVKYHKDIAKNIENVKGGGWFDIKNNICIFHDSSSQFGKALLKDIQKVVNEKKIFTNKYLTVNISDKFKFVYDTGTVLIKLN